MKTLHRLTIVVAVILLFVSTAHSQISGHQLVQGWEAFKRLERGATGGEDYLKEG